MNDSLALYEYIIDPRKFVPEIDLKDDPFWRLVRLYATPGVPVGMNANHTEGSLFPSEVERVCPF